MRALIAAVAFGTTFAATAAPVKKQYRETKKYAVQPGGTFVLENPVGNVQVVGYDGGQVVAVTTRVITGADDAAVEEGRRNTVVTVGGDEKMRVVRSSVTGRTKEWTPNVSWAISLPKNVHLRILSRASDRIHVKNVLGDIFVKNINGVIVLENVTAAAIVDSVNGSIIYNTTQPRRNAMLTTINGNVTATVAPAADFRWIAESIKGDVRTNLPARGAFFGTTFRGSINAPGGPTITTIALMGTVQLLAAGSAPKTAQSLTRPPQSAMISGPVQQAGRNPVPIQPKITGKWSYSTNIGDVRVQEIAGDADIFTGAGEVQLGAVSGSCRVRSYGGPLQLGEVLGPIIEASTRAGDILVDSARQGGMLSTRGGTIRLLYTRGPTRLESGGGDIIVRQVAAGPVMAETRSGDISITLDSNLKSERISATTIKGNIVLSVPARFGADIEATIETMNPDADEILSDLPGLSISKQQIDGGKTRIRATGKLNGGGERVTLQAIGGDIRIATGAAGPTVVTRP